MTCQIHRIQKALLHKFPLFSAALVCLVKIRGVVHLCWETAVGLLRVIYQTLTDIADVPLFLVCDRDGMLHFLCVSFQAKFS